MRKTGKNMVKRGKQGITGKKQEKQGKSGKMGNKCETVENWGKNKKEE